MSQRFVMAHDLARRRAVAAVAEAPEGYVITIVKPKRSGAINAALHAKLTEIASQRAWAGKRWPMEVWKRLLVASWCRANGQPLTLLPALDGAGVDIVQRHTSEMTQGEVSDLLSFIEAWEAELEVAA